MRTPIPTSARTRARRVRVDAYAKVNLGLRVRGRRPDGYHEIDTVLQSVDLYDTLELIPRPDPDGGIALNVRVERAEEAFSLDVPPEANLAVRAAELLRERVGLPQGQGVTIELRKRIPVGAGLGGGSSDAAAVLAGLNALFALELPQHELMALGAALGSDVPFFLRGGRCRARGRGERVEPLPLPLSRHEEREVYALLVPPFTLRTRDVYEAFDELRPGTPDSPYLNDLEGAALALRPELHRYRGFLLKRGVPFGLSGSGPTYFAVLEDERRARALAQEALKELPGVRAFVCRPTRTGHRVLLAT